MDEHQYHMDRVRRTGSSLPQWAKPVDGIMPKFSVPQLDEGTIVWIKGGDVRSRTKTAALAAFFAKTKNGTPGFYWTEEDFAEQRRNVWVSQRTAFSVGDDFAFGQFHDVEEEFHGFMVKPLLIFDHMASLDSPPSGLIDDVTKMLVDRTDRLGLLTIICGDDQRVRRVYGRNEVMGSLLDSAVVVDAVE